MIHRDLCNPTKTKHYSPLRIQFHFLLSRYVCWDGFIPLTRKEIANILFCDIQSIHKFIKKGIREGLLSMEGDRLYLLTRVENHTEGYVKHYPFLESEDFRKLGVHAQRFVLYTLWAGVHTGRPLKRDLSTLYHSTKEACGVLNLYSRALLYPILEEAKQFLQLEIIQYKGKEMVRVTGLKDPFSKQKALNNQGEKKLLDDILEDHDCDELISDTAREEILKLKKHYIQTLNSVGIELFSHALRKLLSLHKVYELNIRGEIGIYLKAILIDLEQKILPTLRNRISHIQQSIVHTKRLVTFHSMYWIKRFETTINELSNAFKLISSKQKKLRDKLIHKEEIHSFPFYNWLENN